MTLKILKSENFNGTLLNITQKSGIETHFRHQNYHLEGHIGTFKIRGSTLK